MTEKERDIKRLIDLAKRELAKPITKEQALASLVAAGILTKTGKYRKPYRELAQYVKK